MNYPVNCDKCTQALYGPVKYCPFCGAAFVSVTGPSEKQMLDSLRAAIDDSLAKEQFTPDIGNYIKKKGKELGVAGEICDSFLLKVLREKKFSPKKENPRDPLSVCWYPTEKRKLKEEARIQPESPIIEEPQPKIVEVKPTGTVAEQQEKKSILANLTINSKPSGVAVFLNGDRKGISPLTINNIEKGHYTVRLEYKGFKTKEEHITIGQEHRVLDVNLEKEKASLKYWLATAAIIGLLMAGLFYSKKGHILPDGKEGPVKPPVSNPVPAPTASVKGGEVEPPTPIIEPEIRNLNAAVLDANDRPIASLVPGQTIKLASEYTIVSSPDVKTIEVEENNYLVMPDGNRTPDAIRTQQRGTGSYRAEVSITIPDGLPPGMYTHVATIKVGDKITKATQPITVASIKKKPGSDQVAKQQEINDYLAEGKRFFENGKYELCIEKMKEVIKRDNNNREAQQYIRMATQKIEDIRNHFRNPTFGGSE